MEIFLFLTEKNLEMVSEKIPKIPKIEVAYRWINDKTGVDGVVRKSHINFRPRSDYKKCKWVGIGKNQPHFSSESGATEMADVAIRCMQFMDVTDLNASDDFRPIKGVYLSGAGFDHTLVWKGYMTGDAIITALNLKRGRIRAVGVLLDVTGLVCGTRMAVLCFMY